MGFLACSSQAFAGKDTAWPSDYSNLTVGGNPAAASSTISGGSGNRHLTITDTITGAKQISLAVTWGIKFGSITRTTVYPKNGVTFTGSTSVGTAVTGLTITPAICDFANDSATCQTTVSFTTPNVNEIGSPGGQVKIDLGNLGLGNQGLSDDGKLFINFNVQEEIALSETAEDTALNVPDPQCFVYKAGAVPLKATLTELNGGTPIPDKQIEFKIEGEDVGIDMTDENGLASLSYNINGLDVGDYNLYASFSGDTAFNPSNDSGTLGIYYKFVGFQPPINPEGNSIFGNGRVLPIKIKLVDANLTPVTIAQPKVWLYQWSPNIGLGEILETPTSVSAADTGNTMRYVPEDQQYIYNWDMSSLVNGTYAVIVDLGDSAACTEGPYQAIITIAKKNKK